MGLKIKARDVLLMALDTSSSTTWKACWSNHQGKLVMISYLCILGVLTVFYFAIFENQWKQRRAQKRRLNQTSRMQYSLVKARNAKEKTCFIFNLPKKKVLQLPLRQLQINHAYNFSIGPRPLEIRLCQRSSNPKNMGYTIPLAKSIWAHVLYQGNLFI